MQLKYVKLAGFKSFVDPTTIPIPSQLVGVVGPNGCGKSNVIDAVRWAMGESAAKNLRGESMIDVIFNGSSQRKAVGQASVELVFDNSMGRLTGQFGSYQEIAVKRVVTRDGDSQYLLNGTRCRRRDIIDLFLGTGAGSRSYAIIGQGTISRIVEARPEELRAYLEEAAGISKYKERRRETTQRITQTRENLARIADIRDELDKQLQRLERQMRAAIRYRQLQEEERQCKAEIIALKWLQLNEEKTTIETSLAKLRITNEQHQTNATNAFQQITYLREQIADETNVFQQLQAHFYQLATEIARLEAHQQQQIREKERLTKEQQQAQHSWQTLRDQLQCGKEQLHINQQQEQIGQEACQQLSSELQQKQQELQLWQNQQSQWQVQWDNLQIELNKTTQALALEQLQSQQAQQRRQELQIRLQKISEEQQDDACILLLEKGNACRTILLENQQQLAEYEQELQSLNAQYQTLRQQKIECDTHLQKAQQHFQTLSVEKASLDAQLKALASQVGAQQSEVDKPRLMELIQVTPLWQEACELVLGNSLYAIVIDSEAEMTSFLQGSVADTIECIGSKSLTSSLTQNRLSDHIQGILPAGVMDLQKIITAQTREEALRLLPQITEQESIITPDGCWMGRQWLRIQVNKKEDQTGVLARQTRAVLLTQLLADSRAEVTTLQQLLQTTVEAIQKTESQLDTHRQFISECKQTIKEHEIAIADFQRQHQQQANKQLQLQEEYAIALQQLEDLNLQQNESTDKSTNLLATEETLKNKQTTLSEEKNEWQLMLANSQKHLEAIRADLHQQELHLTRVRSAINQSENALIRDEKESILLEERLQAINEALHAQKEPEQTQSGSLNDKLTLHAEQEIQIQQSRDKLNHFNQQLSLQESSMRDEEKQVKNTQDKIQAQQLLENSIQLRAESLMSNLDELQFILEDLLRAISSEITLTQREEQLHDIIEKIRRLGAINLAAIDEFDSEAQRKKLLDEQYDDLMEALSVLEAAIEKLDRETRNRLQLTFDEVNRAFQNLFPRLFGGGRAQLQLTDDNLLEAGVVVMAQPPGKRNSTIHLLSGGEKAMTAVALVFAIFQLNPSPFCMLDEVDAPLDDVNVGRFCAMVKEMSQAVQFLFITHNKVTMALADHLIGVTMREPGVSRIVAVDVEQALTMVDA